MNLSRLTSIAAISLAAGAFALASATPAAAKGGGAADVRASGHCSAGSVWKAKAKPDNGRIELEVEIDTNRVGQTWAVGITDNNVRVFSGSRITKAPSGSFAVDLLVPNRAGTDGFVGTARNSRTGETCVARVRL
ncbi:hypothetical protein ABIB25_003756 [Nakamurella sp. UYEF19]|uniref:hypothetical protein n=1 Tax=Nakamurella sp. UYEF19 TaxID=1756392 RepID=UPI0033982587